MELTSTAKAESKPTIVLPKMKIVEPLSRHKQDTYGAELCAWFLDSKTFVENVRKSLGEIGAILSTVNIRLLDGTRNGGNTHAAIIRFHHVSNESKEYIFVVIYGSGIVGREKWLVENNADPVVMSNMADCALVGVTKDKEILVHKGILRSYRSIQKEIRNVLRDCPAKTEMILCGYGVGGAIARVAAFDLMIRNKMNPHHVTIPIRIVSFSSPQYYANSNFHAVYKLLINDDTSYSMAWDPIPRLRSPNSTYTQTHVLTHWIHAEHPHKGRYDTISVTPPRRVAMGWFPLCCGCGSRDDTEEHDIGKILSYLRIKY